MGNTKGFVDRHNNVWVKGESRTVDEHFEWDVQLSTKGKKFAKDMIGVNTQHLNVSMKGKITHIGRKN